MVGLGPSASKPNSVPLPQHKSNVGVVEIAPGAETFITFSHMRAGSRDTFLRGGALELTALLGRTASAAYTGKEQRPPAVVRATSAWVAEGGSREMGRLVPKILHGIEASSSILLEAFRFLQDVGRCFGVPLPFASEERGTHLFENVPPLCAAALLKILWRHYN